MGDEPGSFRLTHIPALDGARGLAVAAVLVFHGGHLLGGYLGVDFFFTLSGFLITSLLLAEVARTGGVGLGGFWARRARRLLPALGVLMVGVLAYCLLIAKPTELAQVRGDGLATLFYAANWRQVFAAQSYWALFTAPSPLNHTWSLAIEEQFYVVWPLLVVGLLAWRRRAVARAVLVTALGLAAVSTLLMFLLYDPVDTNRDYFGTDTRATAILLGAALAAVLAIRGPATRARTRAVVEGAGVIGAVVLGVAATNLDGQSERLYRGGFLVCGLAAVAVIAAAVQPRAGLVTRFLSLRPLCLLGLISYGVYLYHWPIDVVLDAKRVGYTGWPLFVVQTAATLAVATASYRLIEQPIRRGALTTLQLRRLTPAVAVVAVVALLLVTTGARSSSPTPAFKFGFPEAVAAGMRRNAPPGAQRVMIVGDSVAAFLATGMAHVTAKPPVVAFNATQSGCIFPPDLTRVQYVSGLVRRPTPCRAPWESAVVARFQPDVVVWIVSDPAQRLLYHGRWISPCTRAHDVVYARALRDEMAVLGARGGRVVLTTTAYLAKDNAADRRITDCDNRLRRKVAAQAHVQVVDLFSYTCPRGKCREKIDGMELRPDGLHYRNGSERIVARWILDQIRVHA